MREPEFVTVRSDKNSCLRKSQKIEGRTLLFLLNKYSVPVRLCYNDFIDWPCITVAFNCPRKKYFYETTDIPET